MLYRNIPNNGPNIYDLFSCEQSQPDEYHVILMDVQMPSLNGLDATQAIRALPRPDGAAIPVIAMTASSFQKDVEAAAIDAGMTDFISKPLDVSYLYQTLMDSLK